MTGEGALSVKHNTIDHLISVDSRVAMAFQLAGWSGTPPTTLVCSLSCMMSCPAQVTK